MRTLLENKNNEYPQKIFEIGKAEGIFAHGVEGVRAGGLGGGIYSMFGIMVEGRIHSQWFGLLTSGDGQFVAGSSHGPYLRARYSSSPASG